MLQPENAQCYTRRGITRGEIGDYQGAIADFNKAGKISGLDTNLKKLLAYAQMQARGRRGSMVIHDTRGHRLP